jgi:hypothetical protein
MWSLERCFGIRGILRLAYLSPDIRKTDVTIGAFDSDYSVFIDVNEP